jgi:hypothetical protein
VEQWHKFWTRGRRRAVALVASSLFVVYLVSRAMVRYQDGASVWGTLFVVGAIVWLGNIVVMWRGLSSDDQAG